MFLAISRFRVKNDMSREVTTAFINRPKLVDDVVGFIDMEVYQPTDDDKEYWLLTRWTDQDSFHSWHRSDAHHQSHKGIPKGLKLEPGGTSIHYLDKVAD